LIEILGAGDVLGWSWLVPPYRWHFDARALEPTCAIVIDGLCLRGRFQRDHDLGYEITQRFAGIISNRLVSTRTQLRDVYAAED
jgi:CRP-like cAMP-binding protein